MSAASFRKQRLWLVWVSANAGAWMAMVFLFPTVDNVVSQLVSLPPGWALALPVSETARSVVSLIAGTLHGLAMLAIDGAVLGAVLGFAQWLVLRKRIAHGGAWIAATAIGAGIGLSIGFTVIFNVDESLEGFMGLLGGLVLGSAIGAALGIAQWLVLRRIAPASGTWLWASPLAWAIGLGMGWGLGLALTPLLGPDLRGPAVAILQALSALAIALASGVIGGAITGIPLIRMLKHELLQPIAPR